MQIPRAPMARPGSSRPWPAALSWRTRDRCVALILRQRRVATASEGLGKHTNEGLHEPLEIMIMLLLLLMRAMLTLTMIWWWRPRS